MVCHYCGYEQPKVTECPECGSRYIGEFRAGTQQIEDCLLYTSDSMPTELDELRRRVMQMEIEESALKKEEDRLSKERLEHLQEELAELKAQYARCV